MCGKKSIQKPVKNRLILADKSIIEYLKVDSAIYDFPTDIKAVSDPELIERSLVVLNKLTKLFTKLH